MLTRIATFLTQWMHWMALKEATKKNIRALEIGEAKSTYPQSMTY